MRSLIRQLTVPIEFAQKKPTRWASSWAKAIIALEKELKRQRVTPEMIEPLRIPPLEAVGWFVKRKGIAFRCLYQWAMMGTAADPTPRFIGRVDIAFTKSL